MVFASATGNSAANLAYVVLAVIIGIGSISFFVGKWFAGRKEGKKEADAAVDVTVAKTIKNLQDLVDSQTQRMNDQDTVIGRANTKAELLQGQVDKLRQEIDIIKTVPLEKIATTLIAIESHMRTQEKMWADHLKIEVSAATPQVVVNQGK